MKIGDNYRSNQINNKQNVNFGFNFKKINPDRLFDRDIYRRDKFGLAVEKIDFFDNSNKIKHHYRRMLPKNGTPGGVLMMDFSLDGGMKKIYQFFDKKVDFGTIPVERRIRNYLNKQLTSKIREYNGIDNHGIFEGKIMTIYEPGSKTPSEVLHTKRYTHASKGGRQTSSVTKTTTYFDKEGKRTFEKVETPKGNSSRHFDRNEK